MPIPARSRPLRSVSDIRTVTGVSDRMSVPYLVYMQITCLEMEKARKGRERESALGRLTILDARLREIDGQKAGLLAQLAARRVERGLPAAAVGRPAAESAVHRLRY